MTAGKKIVESSHFHTDQVHQPQNRFEAYRESMGVIFDVSRLSVSSGEFGASIKSFHLGDVMLVECDTNGQRFSRSAGMIARDGMDHYLVQLFLKGHTMRRDGKSQAIGGDYSMIVIDAAQPWVADNDNFHNLSLVIPRRALDGKLILDGDHHGRTIDTRKPFGKILADFMLSLYATVPQLGVEEASSLVQPCTDLVAVALNDSALSHPVESAAPNGAHLTAVKGRIRQFIEAQLHRPEFSTEEVIVAFNVSRTHLYRMFAAEGGLACYVRGRRLDLAYRQVIIAPPNGRTISEIAFSLGFKSETVFGRAFKQRFEATPTEVRSIARDIDQPDYKVIDLKGRIWESWLQKL